MKRIGLLLSGRGSNFRALSDSIKKGHIPAQISLVISNRAEAPGLELARKREYPSICIPSKGLDQFSYSRLILRELETAQVDFVCLAGFMRILGSELVRRYPQRILNVHPSLLPAFPGLNAQRQALDWGGRVTGCTVHFVDEELDHGPIIVQHPVPIEDTDTEKSLSARILVHEHQIYPEALKLVCQERILVQGRRVHILPERE